MCRACDIYWKLFDSGEGPNGELALEHNYLGQHTNPKQRGTKSHVV